MVKSAYADFFRSHTSPGHSIESGGIQNFGQCQKNTQHQHDLCFGNFNGKGH